MGLRAGYLQDASGKNVFASNDLQEMNQKLFYQSHEILTENSEVILKVVGSLPTASADNGGRYFLLSSENKIYKCSQIDSVWTWIQVTFSADVSYALPLVKNGNEVSINGLNTNSGSEEKFLTEKGTFKNAISLTIDVTTKHWMINGNDTGVNAEGSRGDVGYVFVPSVDNNGVISWTNNGGLSNPESKNIKGRTGDRGSIIYFGTYITGNLPTGTEFPSSGIESAIIGDMYINENTWNVYKCVYGGAPSTAEWAYIGNIHGDIGPALNIGASGTLENRSVYDNEPMNFIYADNVGVIYRKVSNVSGDWSAPIQIKGDKGDKGDSFKYSDFTQEQLASLRGPSGHSPVITINQTTKHWMIDGEDTGIFAEATLSFDDLTEEQRELIKGEDGRTPTFSIGEVETLPAGSRATVTMSGDISSGYVLNFGIPRGINGGSQGEDMPFIIYVTNVPGTPGVRGTYNSTGDVEIINNVEYPVYSNGYFYFVFHYDRWKIFSSYPVGESGPYYEQETAGTNITSSFINGPMIGGEPYPIVSLTNSISSSSSSSSSVSSSSSSSSSSDSLSSESSSSSSSSSAAIDLATAQSVTIIGCSDNEFNGAWIAIDAMQGQNVFSKTVHNITMYLHPCQLSSMGLLIGSGWQIANNTNYTSWDTDDEEGYMGIMLYKFGNLESGVWESGIVGRIDYNLNSETLTLS